MITFIYLVVMLKLRRMDLIEVYTGLRRSQDKKMEALRERCGLDHQDTLVIGEIIARKALEYSSIRMVTNMKACGPWIRNMVKVLTGEMTRIN